MQATFEEKKEFLLKYPDAFIYHVSLRVPLNHELYTKYQALLNWYLISLNTNITWNIDMIDEFKDDLFPQDEPYWPECFSDNETLPWHSIEFVKRYEHLWDWESIAANNHLKDECKQHFLYRLEQCENYDPNYEEPVDDPFMEEMRLFSPFDKTYTREELKESHKDFHDFLIYHPELAHKEMDWKAFSKNERMYWTEELIEKYEDHWDWNDLSRNPNVPWNYTLLKKYEDRLLWIGRDRGPDEDGFTSISMDGLGSNFGMAWTVETLDAFHHRLGDSHDIILNTKTDWTLAFMHRYAEIWGAKGFYANPKIRETLFAEFDKEENLVQILDRLKDSKSYTS